jgi:hypothetical protein
MAFRGYKGYIDARPECYARAITGGPDIIAEYKNVMEGHDLEAFLQKYRFTHVISAQPAIILQMPYMEDYEPVVVTDDYVLYEHVDWSK